MKLEILIQSTNVEHFFEALKRIQEVSEKKGFEYKIIPLPTKVIKLGSIKKGNKRYEVRLHTRKIVISNVQKEFVERIPEYLKKLEIKADLRIQREYI